MRYCRSCQHLTPGRPNFCTSCGRSFDHKLCPRRHRNARDTEVCAVCGSSDLSPPQRRRTAGEWSVVALVGPLVFLILIAASLLYLAVAISTVPNDAEALLPVLGLGLLWIAFVLTAGALR